MALGGAVNLVHVVCLENTRGLPGLTHAVHLPLGIEP